MSSENTSQKSRPNSIYWRPYLTRYILPLFLTALLLTLLVLPKPMPRDPYPISAMERHATFRYRGSFNRDFNDLNSLQLQVAKEKGITPAHNREELLQRKKLVDISHSKYYKIDELTHSSPLLIPEAAQLLEEIARAFTYELEKDTLPIYHPIVTSVTRTVEDVRGLSRGNINASPNSTHQYGTTFDISWKRFHKVDLNDPRSLGEDELKHLLAIVLKELHEQDRCYIKHERKQACFHITSR